MNCDEVRDELIAYVREELAPEGMAALQGHLAACDDCTKECEGARRVLAMTRLADDASIEALTRDLIVKAIHDGASDIHIERLNGASRTGASRIRFRIDGVLQRGPEIAPEQHEPLIARIKQMADMNITEKQVPQDGRMGITHEGKGYDLRVSVCPFWGAEGVVIRLLDNANVFIGLDRLGLAPQALAQVESLLARRGGMILATGPTDSGKTTLLYSMLVRLNRPETKILTIEEPVEYYIPGLNQMAVHHRKGVTFATGLRAMLRHDPDIIMVGELRDLEPAELAIQASLRKHLVLSTLHANDAPSSVTHLVHMGVEPYLIAASLLATLSQRLARRICPLCAEEHEVDARVLGRLGFRPDDDHQRITLRRGRGCDACHQSGYKGRIGLFELMVVNDEIADLIAGRAPLANIRNAARANGMKTLQEDGLRKVLDGVTTPEEVERVVFNCGH